MPTLTLTITSENWVIFKGWFLKRLPVPIDSGGNPTMSEAEWVKKCLIRHAIEICKQGRQVETLKNLETLGNLIT